MELRNKIFFGSIAGVIIILCYIYSDWHGFKGRYFTDLSRLASAEGIIVSSSTYTSKSKRTIYYHYNIEYEFNVNGRYYLSNEITFSGEYSPHEQETRGYIREYPIGKKVIVYYDPQDPSFSVLEPNIYFNAELNMFFLVIALSISGISGGYLFVRRIFFSNRIRTRAKTNSPQKRRKRRKFAPRRKKRKVSQQIRDQSHSGQGRVS